jgi:uncharacterized protein
MIEMQNIAGPPVEGANFYARTQVVASLVRDLRHHDVLLLGPRRIGKTSVARAVLGSVRAAGGHGMEINVAACGDEAAFVRRLTDAITSAAHGPLGQAYEALKTHAATLTGRIDKIGLPGDVSVGLGAAAAEEWTSVATDALRLFAHAEGRWLVYIDELPIMLTNFVREDPKTGVSRVRRFLDWFRNDVRAMPECKQVRWLLTGSVGLDTLVQRHGMADTINTLRQHSLPPFERLVAVNLLRTLAHSYEIDFGHEDAQYTVDAIGWPQPYYLQRVFNTLCARARAGDGDRDPVTKAGIDEAIKRLTHRDEDNDFHHWERRLALQLGATDGAHAVALLTLAAETRVGGRPAFLLDKLAERMPEATADDQRQRFIELRDVLLRDQYLRVDEATGERRYRFCLEPLRVWWNRRHSL